MNQTLVIDDSATMHKSSAVETLAGDRAQATPDYELSQGLMSVEIWLS